MHRKLVSTSYTQYQEAAIVGRKLCRTGRLLCTLLLCVAGWVPAQPAHSTPSIVWAGCYETCWNVDAQVLWTRTYPGLGTPTKLHGDLDPYDDEETLSPDNNLLLMGCHIYDLKRPGIRYTMPDNDDSTDNYLGEWTPDSKAILAAGTYNQRLDGYTGLYAVGLDKTRRLIAKPYRDHLGAVLNAKYSPDGKLLVLESYTWLQILDAHTGKSLLYKEIVDTLGISKQIHWDILEAWKCTGPRLWLDNTHLVMPRNNALYILDTKQQSIRRIVDNITISTLAHAPGSNTLYASPRDDRQSEHLCTIDLTTETTKCIDIPGLTEIHLFDITRDGKQLLVSACNDKNPDARYESLYLIDTATKRYTVIAKSAFYAAFTK